MSMDDVSALLSAVEDLKSKTHQEEISAEKEEEKAANTKVSDGKTRSALTLTFLWWFFVMLVFSCLFVLWYNSYAVKWNLELKNSGLDEAAKIFRPLELEKILSIIIGALGTSLGFIIGYYFKEKG
ncbi:hypothetical protein [Serratia marcescens]|uniref:hypothetical protein n=1 Tax=Serratia marcescens TaxID=615 RepID=UPI001F43FA7A|nr:hypothetical protein [Serratia marcescens]UIM57458.1 hypothetical protein LXH15_10320 [Serratia marcescens]